MASRKGTVVHEGKQYHSMSISAKLLGISQPQLKKIMVQEDFDKPFCRELIHKR